MTIYRPISLTSVLTRITVVSTYPYPALNVPYMALKFTGQFAFRPAGSTIVTLIAIFQAVVGECGRLRQPIGFRVQWSSGRVLDS